MIFRRPVYCATLLALLLGPACGSKSAQDLDRAARKQTELVDEGGPGPFMARLSYRSPEAMAIQEVPYSEDAASWKALESAVARYRSQHTFLLSVGPKPTAKVDPQNPLALDIENNGGMWRDHARNLQRLMFEMGPLIRLRLPDGREVEPGLVEFQRSFGMGKDRVFMIVFPGQFQGKPLKPPFEVRVHEFGQGLGLLSFKVHETPQASSDWALRRTWKSTYQSNSVQS